MGRDFRKIEAFQLADELVISIYEATNDFPRHEMYGLTSQMRRATTSVPANIAEGSSRKTKKEYLKHLYIAMGSVAELEYFIDLSKRLSYLNNEVHSKLEEQRKKVARKLYRLIEFIRRECS